MEEKNTYTRETNVGAASAASALGTDEDAALCRRHVEEAVFEYCYKKYYNRIRSYCIFHYGLPQTEEDTIQDAFLFFWARGIKRVNLAISPEPYLRAIVKNLFYHILINKRNYTICFDDIAQTLPARDPYAAQRGFYELIAPLDNEEKLIIELCYLYGYDRMEAARIVHVSRRTCFRRLHHAKQKLYRLYGRGMGMSG